MKEFLSRNGHTFVERNVDEDPSAYDDLVARGWRAVPVTFIGDRAIQGFDQAAFVAALASHD